MTQATALDRLGPLPDLLRGNATDAPVVPAQAPTGDHVWLVTDYRLGRLVLTDARFSRAAASCPEAPKVNSANPAPSSMMSMDGAEHTRLRRLVAGAFSPRRIAALEPRVRGLIDRLLDDVAAGPRPVDLIPAFAAPLPIEVISELLGIPPEDRIPVQALAGVLFDVTVSTPRDKARRSFALFEYMHRLVERKRREPADDLLCELIAAHDRGAVTRTELIDLALAILTAGYETTVGQLGLSVLSFLREPAEQPLVEEYLRLTPATPMTFPRVAVEDVELGGVTVHRGQAVVVSLLDCNREPAGTHLTFGHGAHYCLGAGLARLQLNLAVSELLRRFPGLRLADGDDAFGWHAGLATRGLTHLRVTW